MSESLRTQRPPKAAEPEARRAAAPDATWNDSAWEGEPAHSGPAVGLAEAPGNTAGPAMPLVPVVQRKATVAPANDALEQEADAVADRVAAGGDIAPLPVSRMAAAAAAPTIQRMPDDMGGNEPEGDGDVEPIQAKAAGELPASPAGGAAASSAATAAISAPGPGTPLAPPLRSTMEAGLATDLSDVRVHTGPAAETSAAALNARAFTHGRDIWLGRGESAADTRLMAHEVTHVVQQDGLVRRKPQAVPPARNVDEVDEEKERDDERRQGGAMRPAFRFPAVRVAASVQVSASVQARGAGGIDPAASATREVARPAPHTTGDAASNGAPLEDEPAAFAAPAATPSGGESALMEARASEAQAEASSPATDAAAAAPDTASPVGDARGVQAPEAQATGAAAGAAPAAGNAAAVAAAEPDGSVLQGPGASGPPAVAVAGGGAATPSPEAAAEEGGPDEAAAEADTDARMDAARPEADRQAEEAVEGEADAAEAEGSAAPSPSVGEGNEAEAAPDEPDMDDDVAAEPDSTEPDDASSGVMLAGDTASAGLDADGSAGSVGGPSPAVLAPEAATAPDDGVDADGTAGEVEPTPELSQSLAPAERDAGLASIADAGGAEYSGGGGGGGAAVPDLPKPPEPDIPDSNPEAAMAAVSALPAVKLKAALGKVSAAAISDVGGKRGELAASPPTMKRPSGAPQVRARPVSAESAPPMEPVTADVARVPEGAAVRAPAPEPLPAPPPAPTQRVATPAEPADVQGALRNLPTRDPGLVADAGAPPRVPLEGNADPSKVTEQRSELVQAAAELHGQGRRDAAVVMGEDAIFPTVPDETLSATIPAGGGTGAGGGAGGAAGGAGEAAGADGDAVSIIAEEKHGPEIRAATAQAQSAMAERRQEHAEQAAEERAASDEEIRRLEADNAADQAAERSSAQADVAGQRQAWRAEQDQMSEAGRSEAESVTTAGQQDVAAERDSAEAEAGSHVEAGNREATRAREDGEATAARERARGEQEAESGGVFGWIRSRARAFFDGIKRGIQAAFERARSLVRAAIERARSLALAVIERARQAIVAVIRRVGDALIAIGNRLLAGFPALRDRFRAAIQARVAAAEAAVNRLADRLRDGVNAALDALGAALDAALGLLERGLLAAVDAAAAVVDRAISAAEAVAQAIGQFAALVRDVAAGPARWIANLGSSVVDGIRNHLWTAFRTEVRNWFNSKLEEVLGVGTAIWGLLRQGGIGMAEIGRMAFEALKSAIPVALIQLLIEKLVSMIVPAAGAVMAIIEGIQAAWGTVSRIITAFSRFFAFLRAVKPGNAGPQFASALAAAAVVVIDFVANWLLRRLMRPARAVAGRVRAIAQCIMRRLRAVGRRAGRAVRRAGRAVRRGVRRMRARGRRRRRQRQRDRGQRDRRRADERRRRLDRAVSVLRPQIEGLLRRRVSRLRLRAQLAIWRARHRLRMLRLSGRGTAVSVEAGNSLAISVVRGIMEAEGQRVYRMVREIADDLLRGAQPAAAGIHAQRQADSPGGRRGTSADSPVVLPANIPAQAADIRAQRPPGFRSHYELGGASLTEFRGLGTTAGNIRVQSPSIGGGAYGDIVPRLPSLAPAGTAPGSVGPVVGSALTSFGSRGILPPGTGGNVDLAAAVTRLGAVEGARDPGYLVTRAATMEGLSQGSVTPHEAFVTLNPMERASIAGERPGAPRTAAELARHEIPDSDFRYRSELSGRQAEALPGEMNRFMRVEREAIIRAVIMRLQRNKPLFRTESDLRTFIRRELQDELARIARRAYPT